LWVTAWRNARRHFVDVVVRNFPAECRYVLEILGEVFHQDVLACEQQMGPDERLRFHQQHSSPLMESRKKNRVAGQKGERLNRST
jgi:transposase